MLPFPPFCILLDVTVFYRTPPVEENGVPIQATDVMKYPVQSRGQELQVKKADPLSPGNQVVTSSTTFNEASEAPEDLISEADCFITKTNT